MSIRSKVTSLPQEMQSWLEQTLVANGFSGYAALEDALRDKGYEISKSSLHRYGQEFSERVAALKKSQQMAAAILAEAGDGDANLASAVNQLALDRCMHMLMQMELNPETVDFADLMKAVAALTRSAVTVKQFQAKAREKAKLVAAETEKVLKKVAGLSDEAADEIKRKILGIAD